MPHVKHFDDIRYDREVDPVNVVPSPEQKLPHFSPGTRELQFNGTVLGTQIARVSSAQNDQTTAIRNKELGVPGPRRFCRGRVPREE